MGLKKIISAVSEGYMSGLATGIGFPSYLVKKVLGKDYSTMCESADSGKYVDPDLRATIEYQIAKGVGDVMGFFSNAGLLFIGGIYADIKLNKDEKKWEEEKKERDAYLKELRMESDDILRKSILSRKEAEEILYSLGGPKPEEPN